MVGSAIRAVVTFAAAAAGLLAAPVASADARLMTVLSCRSNHRSSHASTAHADVARNIGCCPEHWIQVLLYRQSFATVSPLASRSATAVHQSGHIVENPTLFDSVTPGCEAAKQALQRH